MNAQSEDLEKLLEPFRQMAMFEGCDLVSPESRGLWGDTPLHVAAFVNDLGALKSLMPFVRDIDVVGELGFTPLHNAILHGSVESAAYLISLGADVECVNGLDEDALMMMAEKPEFAGLLTQLGLRAPLDRVRDEPNQP